jgi:hypothetical protein
MDRAIFLRLPGNDAGSAHGARILVAESVWILPSLCEQCLRTVIIDGRFDLVIHVYPPLIARAAGYSR